MAETIVVTGATGLIGRQVCKQLIEAGHTVRSLSRSAKPHPVHGVETFTWDIGAGQIDQAALTSATAIIHLAGENIAGGRWTEARRRLIWESRIQTAALLHSALGKADHQVKTVVGVSGIGYYARNRRPMDERAPAGNDFPAEVCKAWEAAETSLADGRRLVIFRVGVVLSRDGGAFPRLAAPVKNWVGTWVGSGIQVLSWIHVRDMAALLVRAVENPEAQGIYNAVASEPCNMRFFLKQLGRYYHRPIWPFPIPSWAIKLVYGDMAQLILEGDTIISNRLSTIGYTLKFPHLYEALGELCRKRKG